MKTLKNALSHPAYLLLPEAFIIFIISLIVYGGIFLNLLFILLILINTINLLTSTKKSKSFLEKHNKTAISITLFLALILPATFIYNLPKYTYNDAVKFVGETKQKDGAKSFKYDSKSSRSTTLGTKTTKLLTCNNYLIYAQVNGKDYMYIFNPYSGELSEDPLNVSGIDYSKYKTLY